MADETAKSPAEEGTGQEHLVHEAEDDTKEPLTRERQDKVTSAVSSDSTGAKADITGEDAVTKQEDADGRNLAKAGITDEKAVTEPGESKVAVSKPGAQVVAEKTDDRKTGGSRTAASKPGVQRVSGRPNGSKPGRSRPRATAPGVQAVTDNSGGPDGEASEEAPQSTASSRRPGARAVAERPDDRKSGRNRPRATTPGVQQVTERPDDSKPGRRSRSRATTPGVTVVSERPRGKSDRGSRTRDSTNGSSTRTTRAIPTGNVSRIRNGDPEDEEGHGNDLEAEEDVEECDVEEGEERIEATRMDSAIARKLDGERSSSRGERGSARRTNSAPVDGDAGGGNSIRDEIRAAMQARNARRGARRKGYERATAPGAVATPGRAYGSLPNWALRRNAARNAEGRSSRGLTQSLSASTDGEAGSREQVLPELTAAVVVEAVVDGEDKSMFRKGRRILLTIFVIFVVIIVIAAVSLAVSVGGGGDEIDPMATFSPTHRPTSMPTVELDDIIAVLSEFTSVDDLRNQSKPQNHAMLWLAKSDELSLSYIGRNFRQIYAMAVLFYAFYPDRMKSGGLLETLGSDVCHFGGNRVPGVDRKCKDKDIVLLMLREGKVGSELPSEIRLLTALETFGCRSEVTGTIPSSITELTELRTLAFVETNLVGKIPADIGKLSQLETLELHGNDLSGGIPSSLYDIQSLRALNLGDNMFNGTVKEEDLKKLSNLQYLLLSGNKFTGDFPFGAFDSMPHLDVAYIDRNKFTGQVDLNHFLGLTEFRGSFNRFSGTISGSYEAESNITARAAERISLEYLDLSSNLFTGRLPEVLQFITSLEYLDLSGQLTDQLYDHLPDLSALTSLGTLKLSGNKFYGTLPNGLPPSLQYIDLSYNDFSDDIPTEIGALSNLERLILDENRKIEGQLPSEIGQLTNLKFLSIISLSLNGSMPTEIGNLKNLEYLYFSNTMVGDPLPTEIGNLVKLVELDLSFNNWSGVIPTLVGNLVNLSILRLEQNKLLTGTIPTELGNLHNLQLISLFENDFQGQIPDELCEGYKPNSNENMWILRDCDRECGCCDNGCGPEVSSDSSFCFQLTRNC